MIFVHQVSTYAPYYDEWKTNGNGGHLDELLSITKTYQPEAAIGFVLIHCYSSDYAKNTGNSSYARWELISESVRRLCDEYGFDYVIPYRTAFQNIRSSSLNDIYDLTQDGTHCGMGLSRYTAACCYYETIIAPRTGISVLGNPARFIAPSNNEYKSNIDLTDLNVFIAQKAAYMAKNNWYSYTNPELSLFE